jgi:MFS transporter, NNP family, nitrate/nitrite transporter
MSAIEIGGVSGFPPEAEAGERLRRELRAGLRDLHPAYFALVMATGIVAIAAHLFAFEAIASVLNSLNATAYLALLGLLGLRVLLFPGAVFHDLIDYGRGPGFFTVVAATAIVGIQAAVEGSLPLARVLWIAAIPLWAICMYSVLTAFTVREDKPTLAEGIHGGWLLAIVATQAIAHLGGLLAPTWGIHERAVLFFCLSLWLCGGMLYIWMISLIFYRYTFFPFAASDLMPPYWINMGAMAIATLAGTTMIRVGGTEPHVARMLPFLIGFTMLFWATATWWIPMLLILALWRRFYKKFPFSYDPLYWGAVFPLGMYAVATYRLAEVLEAPFLFWIPQTFLVLALGAWTLTFIGLARSLARMFLAAEAEQTHPPLIKESFAMNAIIPSRSRATLQLMLATGAFAVCFAVFGSVSAMMPIVRQQLHLTPLQVSIALAVPILLGSLGRIPLGMLTDRYGGRRVFAGVMAFSIVPSLIMGSLTTFGQLVICGFFIGVALASFSVGVGFASRWYPPEKQGTALGIYGAGNIGQSLAAFGSPVLAGAIGYVWGFRMFGLILAAWLVLWLVFAADARTAMAVKSWREMLQPLLERQSWKLSIYYFLTFGGFVAMGVYLPIFLTEIFKLTPKDAGFRTAGFIVLATAMRPLGGWLADHFGGRAILTFVFPGVAVMAGFLTLPRMVPFTIGALGMAALIGLGNGAVFKLVPEYFPQSVGAVTGLVGAAGGLGGFFPPLVLGVIRQLTGAYTYGFVLLGVFALLAFVLVRPRVLALCLVPPAPHTRDEWCSRAHFCVYANSCLTDVARAKLRASGD